MNSGLFNKFKQTQPDAATGRTAVGIESADDDRTMSAELFARLRDFIYEQCGIYFAESKKYLLEARLSRRLAALQIKTYREYLRYASASVNTRTELPALFDAITINETYFFRNPPQFNALETIILPEIIAQRRKKGVKTIRLWSAACSSGEEPYTMAMLILEKIKPRYPDMKFEIIGNDINTKVLQRARVGVYKEYSIRNMPKHYLLKYFSQEKDKYILNQNVRDLVRFISLNLYDARAMRSMINFDVIFCCNVLIYFDARSKQQVISNLYNSLGEMSYLFIGYSESLHGISKAFKLVHFPKTIAYKRE